MVVLPKTNNVIIVPSNNLDFLVFGTNFNKLIIQCTIPIIINAKIPVKIKLNRTD